MADDVAAQDPSGSEEAAALLWLIALREQQWKRVLALLDSGISQAALASTLVDENSITKDEAGRVTDVLSATCSLIADRLDNGRDLSSATNEVIGLVELAFSALPPDADRQVLASRLAQAAESEACLAGELRVTHSLYAGPPFVVDGSAQVSLAVFFGSVFDARRDLASEYKPEVSTLRPVATLALRLENQDEPVVFSIDYRGAGIMIDNLLAVRAELLALAPYAKRDVTRSTP